MCQLFPIFFLPLSTCFHFKLLVKPGGLAILFGFNVELNQATFSTEFFTRLKSKIMHYDLVDRTKINEFQTQSNDICNYTSTALQDHVQQEGNGTAKL